MSNLSPEDRVFIIQNYYKSGNSIQNVQLQWRIQKKTRDSPSFNAIKNVIHRLEVHHTVDNLIKGHSGRKRTARTEDNVKLVREFLRKEKAADRRVSTRKAALRLNIRRTSLQNILNDIGAFPYKISRVQPLKDASQDTRKEFAIKTIEMLQRKEIDHNKIWFSDEAHFWLDGYVNVQNFRIWGTENPRAKIEKPLHPLKVTVWCALSASGIIGPFFFDTTVGQDNYLEMLHSQFLKEATKRDVIKDHWFMQDGAPAHTAKKPIQWLSNVFGHRLIALKAPAPCPQWPPYSPDLNPCDFFLWGYLKDKIYSKKIQDQNQLKKQIIKEISLIDETMLSKVADSFVSRLGRVRAVRGSHFELLS